MDQSKMRRLRPPPAISATRCWTFSKTRGAPAMNVGRITARLSTSLGMRPSTAEANPTASWADSSTFPNECDSGSHRYCTSSGDSSSSAWIAAPS
jgi:hypothetical protein